MAAIVVPFVMEVTWSGLYGPRPWANVMHIVYDAPDQGTRDAAVDDIAVLCGSAWNANIEPVVSAQMSLTNIRVQDLDSLSGQTFNQASAAVGDLSGESMPPNVSVLVTKNTTHDRTQRNGRWFQAGISETIVDNPSVGTLDSGGLTTMQTAFSGFYTDLIDTVLGYNFYPIVLSRSSAPSGYTPRAVTSLTVEATLATQRRRLRK